MNVFDSAERAYAYVNSVRIDGASFEVAIADGFTFAGSADVTGAGMALVLDAILAQGYVPDGFDQREGFRVYRYVPIPP